MRMIEDASSSFTKENIRKIGTALFQAWGLVVSVGWASQGWFCHPWILDGVIFTHALKEVEIGSEGVPPGIFFFFFLGGVSW